MEVTNKQMIESAKTIKKGCEERKCCEDCLFCNLKRYGNCSFVDDMPNSWFIPSLNPKLSEAEKAILLNLDPKCKWMTRDAGGDIYIHYVLPKKESHYWNSEKNCFGGFNELFTNLFAWCKWEDEEPWYIPDLLKEK